MLKLISQFSHNGASLDVLVCICTCGDLQCPVLKNLAFDGNMVLFILPLPGSLPLQDSCDRSTFNSTETISYSWPNKKKRLIAWTHSTLQSKHYGPRHDNKIFAAEYAIICNSKHSILHLKLYATLDSNYLVTVSMLNLLGFFVWKIYTELKILSVFNKKTSSQNDMYIIC